MGAGSWVLILTLSNAGTTYSGKAIEHIPGFDSKLTCTTAANNWKAQLSKDDQKLASFACVNTDS